jgi:polysaccharide export outer membrane protein
MMEKLMKRRFANATCVVALVVGLSGLVGCARPGAEPPPRQEAGLREPYVIGIPDTLRISVWKNPDLSVDVPVRSDGMISVPLLDDVQAEGLTPAELKEVVSERLSEYITAPDVTVIVLRPSSRAVTVMGAVGRSGIVQLDKEMRVTDAIAAMGGFTVWAKRSDVRILRPVGDDIVSYRFNYGAYVSGKELDANIVLQPGDTVVVPD